MPSRDINAHMYTGVHVWFPKAVKIWASINFKAPERKICGWTGLLEFCESAALGT